MSWQHLDQPVWLERGAYPAGRAGGCNTLSHMWEPSSSQAGWLEQILFYSILFYSIPFLSFPFLSSARLAGIDVPLPYVLLWMSVNASTLRLEQMCKRSSYLEGEEHMPSEDRRCFFGLLPRLIHMRVFAGQY